MPAFLYAADLFGVAVFAVSGALMAGRKSLDIFGVLVIATLTALGGGTLRDVILDRHPVAWIADPAYIAVAAVAALATVAWVRMTRPVHETGLLVADAFGLAVFTVIGTDIALAAGVPVAPAVILGVTGSVAGGVMRDVICNEIPLIFRKDVYATACIAGALALIGLRLTLLPPVFATLLAMTVVLAIRLAAIRWQLSLPRFHLLDRD